MAKQKKISEEWLQEIRNETEHYYQGEMQQDQRASWLLANASALITLLIGLKLSALDKKVDIPPIPFFFSLAAYLLSALIAIKVMLPVTKLSSLWDKLYGNKYKKYQGQKAEGILEGHFQPDAAWSDKSLEKRLAYHFRSHLERNIQKARGIVWVTIFFIIGLGFSAWLVIALFLIGINKAP